MPKSGPTGHLQPRQIKQRGAHYTPGELARFLAERAIAQLGSPFSRPVHGPSGPSQPQVGPGTGRLNESVDAGAPIRVLDPACGYGSLLRAVWDVAPHQLRKSLVLRGYETDKTAADVARKSAIEVVEEDFLSPSGPPPPADLIISNPPYVRTQVLGAKRAQELADRFGLTGRVDLYHAFVCAMTQVLRPGGVLALLTSNRFMTTLSGAATRRLLVSAFELKEVYDLGDTKLFGAAVLPAIVIAQKLPGDPERSAAERRAAPFCRVYESPPNGDSPTLFDHVLQALPNPQIRAARVKQTTYRIDRGEFHPNGDPTAPWSLHSPTSRRWLDCVTAKTVHTFADVAEIRVGIKTTADNVFIRDDWSDQELLRPLLTHHVAQRWRLDQPPRTRVLYPHTTDANGKRISIDLSRYPHAAAYLNSHRKQLTARKYVAAAGRRWYEIWVPQQPHDWPKPKIVWPDISESPAFFLDTSGAIVNGDCYWMTLREGIDPRWLEMLLAVANSTFIERFYDTVFHNKLYAGRRRFMTQYVKTFPLPTIDVRIVALVRHCLDGRSDAEAELNALVASAFS
jgi:adenine-specific DNA-methyltransferase